MKKAYYYSRLSMISKFNYVGVSTEDLLDVYVLFIRSIVEYCAVVWHSSLTSEQSNSLEMIQKTCLRVILGENYVSYEAALEMCDLVTLSQRREDRCLSFARKCLKHPDLRKIFPLNSSNPNQKYTSREKYVVNFARTETYKMSTVPFLQRKLNAL